ncbi:group III truncated hemoglobin [Chryseotalea sanaruensis]|uniref:Group III truncated hemoglobin n=1 Tax=Chryseotalea sanaruensis TaxID=2482724 RepID=A0A401UEX1_9BACT|nr:group III truncated hemoglobin [Chryseotalea sanaruensis]GCC53417.1 group III truncated hemoglobin [Chryseotalea sanaruensis]
MANTKIKILESRADIELLVNSFYAKVKEDELLAPLFRHVDWPAHLPIMYKFWASMLLGEQSYQGSPFDKHKDLPVQTLHFDRWVLLFCETVDEHFMGEKADEAKSRGQHIAAVFQHKMNLFK